MSTEMDLSYKEMPRYGCHKEVWALKIKDIITDEKVGTSEAKTTIVPEDSSFCNIVVDAKYITKHNPKVGGYYVVYEDGYESWSPAGPFENGYTIISE